MSFPTLSRKAKTLNHMKQSSFDVSEIAAAGRLNKPTDSSSGRISPLKRLGQFFRRQTSEPTIARSDQSLSQEFSKKRIFGRPVSEICTPQPPKPILELLMFLQEVGPFTREIFRKPPNARKCRLVVEKLNSDEFEWDVDESCNGLLLAAVLKTFLREIPHKLCDDRMYNQWAAITQKTDEHNHEHTVTQIKSLLGKLPESNQLLMKIVIGILHRIQQRSMENLMNSYNLSVCLGPCLLWTTSANCREVEKASKSVPSLVQFMIENCVQVFGRDALNTLRTRDHSLARNTSMSLDSIFTEKPNRYVDSHSVDTLTDQLGRQQKSPSRLSFDSGMIIDDTSHDDELTNDNKESQVSHKRFNLSYDSLDCDAYISDEDISEIQLKHNNNNSFYVNTAQMSVMPSSHVRPVIGGKKEVSPVAREDNYQSTITPDHVHRRACGYSLKRDERPQSTPEDVPNRKPCVLYDKIVYRYIDETPVKNIPTQERFYSLPRPAHKINRPPLTSVTCGQSSWTTKDSPMIIVDQDTTDLTTEHISRLQILPNKFHLSKPSPLNLGDVTDSPIYENTELYGPSATLNRPRPRGVTQSVPIYENLALARAQPVTRCRRRTLNTTNNYSTYRQQTNHSRAALLPLLEQRNNKFIRQQRMTTSGPVAPNHGDIQETCYFV